MTDGGGARTRMYTINPNKSGWARIWITGDGCFTCISDYGNYGYWWTAVDGPFRVFLIGCDDAYLGGKLSDGALEFDAERTRRVLRERILRHRREGRISKHTARREWKRAARVEDEESWREWFTFHGIADHEIRDLWEDHWEHGCYGYPSRVRGFLKKVWPLFIEQLKVELSQEAPVEQASP